MCLEHTKVCQTNIFQTYDIKKYDFETVLWTLQKKIFKSAQVFYSKEGTWRVQSLLNDDGIFFTVSYL